MGAVKLSLVISIDYGMETLPGFVKMITTTLGEDIHIAKILYITRYYIRKKYK